MSKMSFAIITMVLASPASLFAAESNPDATFYKKAAEGGMAEVELGKLVLYKRHGGRPPTGH